MGRIGLGIVGTGRMAAGMTGSLRHVEALEPVAVSSGTPARAQQFADEHGAMHACTSVEEMAAREDVQAVYVAGRTGDHATAARAALGAGKPVLVEKPLATDLSEAQDLLDFANSRGVLLVENLWTLALPSWKALAAAAQDGSLGAPRNLDFSFGYPTTAESYPSVFSASDGGALRDRAVYGAAMALSVLGPVEDVQAIMRVENGIDLSADLVLRHENGAVSHIAVTLDSLLGNIAVLSGTGGMARLDAPVLGSERMSRQWMEPIGAATGGGIGARLRSLPLMRRLARARSDARAETLSYGADQYAPMLSHFADLVMNGAKESPLVPAHLSLAVQQVLSEARRQMGKE